MKKIHFRFLFLVHMLKQAIGIKSKENPVIKIWWCDKTFNTFLYAGVRSGFWYMPVGAQQEQGRDIYSYWLVDLNKTEEYGLNDKKKNKTVYKLMETAERKESKQ